jgi:hypothetical protein
MNLTVEINKSKLCFSCYCYENYFKISYYKEYTLEELKTKLNYFKQFNEEKEILLEMKFNELKGKEKIIEENSEIIKLIIPLTSKIYKFIEFDLQKIKKTNEELLQEYKSVVEMYQSKLQIQDFNSRIIIDIEDKEMIKSYISYYNKFRAQLLYSFYITYTDEDIKYNNLENKKIDYTVKEFHDKCDNHSSILVVCKSGDQIFGGYTSLQFKSDNSYGNDKCSFIFSLNRKQKYAKISGDSIWCYKNWGPCFNYDLEFIKGKINIVKFYKYCYDIPDPFFQENDKYIKNKGSSNIVLDSLEIFQIKQN